MGSGPGADARLAAIYPGSLALGGEIIPATVVPRTFEHEPSEGSRRWLVCAIDEKKLNIVEVEVVSRDGQLYTRKVSAKVADLPPDGFPGDLGADANSWFPAMVDTGDMEAVDLRIDGATDQGAEQRAYGVEALVSVLDPYFFCNDEPSQRAVCATVEQTNKLATSLDCHCEVDSCEVANRRLSSGAPRRLTGNVHLRLTLWFPPHADTPTIAGLAGTTLDAITVTMNEQMAAASRGPGLISMLRTPQSLMVRSASGGGALTENLPPGLLENEESMPAESKNVVTRGSVEAVKNIFFARMFALSTDLAAVSSSLRYQPGLVAAIALGFGSLAFVVTFVCARGRHDDREVWATQVPSSETDTEPLE